MTLVLTGRINILWNYGSLRPEYITLYGTGAISLKNYLGSNNVNDGIYRTG